MDKIKKLLQKISVKDRQVLLTIINKLIKNEVKNSNIVKVKNTDFFRLKSGRFRIIFHKDDKSIIIDSIRLRNENTYKNL